jgi:hypothetical protein
MPRGWRPSQTSHVGATSAKTAIQTALGPYVSGFRKLGDGSYRFCGSRTKIGLGDK